MLKRLVRGWVTAIIVVAAILVALGFAGAGFWPGSANHGSVHGQVAPITGPVRAHPRGWLQRDRAIYAVSTLNAPLCSNGKRLATTLWWRDRARTFDVLHSKYHHNLYYLQVWTARKALVGVYAFKLGWKRPRGIYNATCVRAAPPGLMRGYHRGAVMLMTRFHSTLPHV